MIKNRPRQPLNALLAAMTTLPLLIGCPSTGEPSTVNSPAPTNSPAPANSPTSTPERISAIDFPEQPFPIPGWFAVGTKPKPEGIAEYPFSPTNPDAEIAIFSDEWSEVPSGAALIALTAAGQKQEVQFRRSAEEPYGCDDIPTPMATFSASKPMSEGGFWLLPASAANSAKAIPLEDLPLDELPTNLLPPEKRQATEARAWQAGNSIILLAKETEKEAKLSIFNNSEEIFSTGVEVLGIEGSYDEPLDFSLPFQPGIPTPIGVFQFDSASQVAIALWHPSFEGHHFEVVASNQEKMELFNVRYVYYCAF
ncbi:MAG: hypothetical protein SXA11_14585 [Cyanobacteriota bacterium]|nr:hypothetical protein [Cyanobacteriota bacterium]